MTVFAKRFLGMTRQNSLEPAGFARRIRAHSLRGVPLSGASHIGSIVGDDRFCGCQPAVRADGGFGHSRTRREDFSGGRREQFAGGCGVVPHAIAA
jgi:hypothetical protein